MSSLQDALKGTTVAQAELLKNRLTEAELYPRFRDYWSKLEDEDKLARMPYEIFVILNEVIGYKPTVSIKVPLNAPEEATTRQPLPQ